MAKNQTFSVSLSLLTKNFQKGVKTIQTSLNNLKMQFRNFAGALGAGLGISEIARNMIDSAKKLDKAQTVLKNVSNGIEAYGQNQKFVMDISKKYSQEITTLMDNYAKFHAVANQSNMPLKEQQYIYESLTRAAAYFNLSADDTNGVMLAITQMMSKGKVSSEELRQQLGERLPGAMGLMAKGLGVTNEQLEDMLKKGQILASDALPKFAQELNNVTKNLDTDTIQGATARLKNAFTELTGKLNIGGIYKNILNGVGNGVQYIADNLNSVKTAIISLFAGLTGGSLWNKARNGYQEYFQALKDELKVSELEFKQYSNRLKKFIDKGQYRIEFDGFKLDSITPLGETDPQELKYIGKTIEGYNQSLEKATRIEDLMTSKFGQMKDIAGKVGMALKGFLVNLAPAAIIAAVTAIISKFVEWRKEMKRIKNLAKDTEAEFKKTVGELGLDEVDLNTMEESLNKVNILEEERIRIINRINQLLGRSGDLAFDENSANEEINKAIKERLELIKKEKEYQTARQILAEKETRRNELEEKKKAKYADIEKLKEKKQKAIEENGGKSNQYIDNSFNELIKSHQKEIDRFDTEIGELNKVIVDFRGKVKEGSLESAERQAIISNAGYDPNGGGDNSLAEQYKEIQDEYNQNLRTLNERKKNQLITEDEYKKELEELTLKTAESILALNDIDENTDEFAKSILESAKAFIANVEKEDKVKDALDDYYNGVRDLYNQYNNGVITQEQLDEGMMQLLEQTVLAVSAMGDLSGSAQRLADEFNKRKKDQANKAAGKIADPVSGTRDATFDYNKSESDILGEVADIYRNYESQLKDTIKELENLEPTDEILKRLEELNAELQKATANAQTMEEAMKLSKVGEDIKDLKKEVATGIWNNFSGIADAAERLTNSVKECVEAFEDPDISGWEKILNIFNMITQVTDTIFQSVQMISQLTEVMDKLKQAEASYQAIQAAGAAQTMASAGATVTAKQAEATASGTAEAAKMPFPYNLLAIAGVVGLIAGIFASLPKFAGGGIVQGSSTMGDHNLARVNAGEMILNKQQQSTLFGMLNGSNSGALGKNGGNVEFKIRGTELVGVLKNHSSRMKG